jgi:hypothetical protein
MNAVGSLPTRAASNQARQQAWDIPIGHSRPYDPMVTLDRPGMIRAVDGRKTVRCDLARPLIACWPPPDLTTEGRHSNKIRSDGDQILKPIVGIFPQIPHNHLPWLRCG